MQIDWTKHLKDPEEKKRFEVYLQSCGQAFRRLQTLLKEKENALNSAERSVEAYDSPNWAERQAHRNGNMEMLWFLKTLVDLDQQKEPKT